MLRITLVPCVLLLLVPRLAQPQTAPDATPFGPLATTSAEYKLPAAIDPDVTTALATELWARVYRPLNLTSPPYPLLVFLHGNHATCGRFEGAGPGRLDISVQYTFTGTCPPGFVVVPSHDGYGYLTERLASWGFIVVSINANRGVNAAPGVTGDRGLNLRRGRLVLKHLQRLSEWNSSPGTTPASLGFDLFGMLDFSHVGLLGHSRGGEGMRAAYNLFRDPAPNPWPGRIGPMHIDGIFEIGPVDGQTGRVLNADGTVWNVLLPMCDGDVFNLQGVRPFDRMLRLTSEIPATQKSTYTVWGANHNFYNTEWQLSDSVGCLGHKRLFGHLLGSSEQRLTALASVLAFFRGNVGPGADAAFNQNFNPEFTLPEVVAQVTRIDRGYTDSPNAAVTTIFDDFDQPTGFNSSGASNTASGVTVIHGGIANHSPAQRVAQISWTAPSPDTFFQSNWTPPGMGRDATGFETLDFRVSRQCRDATCTEPDSKFLFTTNFSIRLAGADGTLSTTVQLQDFVALTGPVGGLLGFLSGFLGFGVAPHPILETARIPLSAFGGVSLGSLRGVRFTFDDTADDEIFIGNIRLSTVSGTSTPATTLFASVYGADSAADTGADASSDQNAVKAIRRASSSSGAGSQRAVEIELTSNREFLPHGELLVLRIGSREFALSRYPDDGDTRTIIFTLTSEEYGLLSDGDPVRVQYGTDHAMGGWSFLQLNKPRL